MARFKVIGLVMVMVALLMAIAHFSASNLWFYLLFPGEVTSLLITGGHGGTRMEGIMAPIACFLVNSLTYFLLL